MNPSEINNLSIEKQLGAIVSFGLHTTTIYLCSLHFFPWLISRCYVWLILFFHISTYTSAGEWYMRHFEVVNIIPAIILGYVAARSSNSVATWAWTVPTVVLLWRLIRYNPSSSVFSANPPSVLNYFFDIQHFSSSFSALIEGDPERTLAQLTVVAPFYAAVSYSLGAFISKRKIERCNRQEATPVETDCAVIKT